MTSKNTAAEMLKVLSRRQALGFLGSLGAGAGLALGCGSSSGARTTDAGQGTGHGGGIGTGGGADAGLPSCIITPAATEGPFFVDEKLNRSDLITGETDPGTTAGYPLTVNLAVWGMNGQTCQALAGAYVDIWHANVNGLYSDEPANFVQSTDTKGQTYLRGYQVSGDNGVVTFRTIYPGWYATRTIHIHVKVRLYDPAGNKTLEANAQLYFEDAINDSILALPAYAARGPRSIPKNTNDQVFNGTGPGSGIDGVGLPSGQVPPGAASIAATTAFDSRTGSTATLKIGVQLG